MRKKYLRSQSAYDDIDLENGIQTISKITFFKRLEESQITLLDAKEFLQQTLSISENVAFSILYDIATEYDCKNPEEEIKAFLTRMGKEKLQAY